MANSSGLPLVAKLRATFSTISQKTKKTKVWLREVSSKLNQNKTLIDITRQVRTHSRQFMPNWQTSNGIVALLLFVLITNIVVVRAQEENKDFLDVDPATANQILDAVAPYTPFDENVDQAKLSTSGQTDGYVNRPDFKETRQAGFNYTVQVGDTLDKIAKQNGVNVATLLEANGIAAKDIANLKTGTVLHIPPYNTSDSTAWIDETKKISQARLEAHQREAVKRKLALAQRDSVNRGSHRRDVEKSDASLDGQSQECSINPVPDNLGISRGISRFHKGLDIRGNQGTPIVNAKNGIVAEMGWERGFGNTIVMNVGGGETQRHGHLSRFGDVSVGQTVAQGQVIGYVGSTGWSTGPHDHFEVRRNGVVINGLAC